MSAFILARDIKQRFVISWRVSKKKRPGEKIFRQVSRVSVIYL